MQKLLLVFILGLVTMLGGVAEARFVDDADIAEWAWESVYTVDREGIMTGFGDNTFGPNQTINRAQALVILFRTKGVDPADMPYRGVSFSDVPRNAWFTKAVEEAHYLGWVTGYSDGTFRPEAEVSRAEWATLIQRAFGLSSDKEVSFEDIPADAWFREAVAVLEDNTLIRLKTRNFDPTQKVTRADASWYIATILERPAILGTSEENELQAINRRDARKVAVRPSNFDVNDQGFDIPKEEFIITATHTEDRESFPMSIRTDWTLLGAMTIKNTYDKSGIFNSAEFKLRFPETNMGPASSFMIKIMNDDFVLEKQFGSTGSIIFTGFDKELESKGVVRYNVFVRPIEDGQFFGKSGPGTLAIFDAKAIIQSNEKVAGPARVTFESTQFAPIDFDPMR